MSSDSEKKVYMIPMVVESYGISVKVEVPYSGEEGEVPYIDYKAMYVSYMLNALYKLKECVTNESFDKFLDYQKAVNFGYSEYKLACAEQAEEASKSKK